ncbi:winged helix-turn-helix domain-containing protein [Agrobacterium sp. NPDC090273]|uniref:winged helix-turn-helix domain-containing protein n=1 Tax=Agrobacterium sp. NPDC090273 TaxID=3363919 RepID=UPI00383A848F
MSNASLPLKPVLRIDFPPGDRLGHGRIELMELIADTGSISAAGRAMDMSYRRAWLLVDALNHMFRQPVIESQRGGKQGGGASLTPFGVEVLERYRAMELRMNDALRADLDWLEANRNLEAGDAINRDQEPPIL